MTWDDFWWLRIVNILASMLSMTLLGMYLVRKREVTPRRYRRIGWCFWLILCVVAYATGRAASLGAPIAEHTMFSAGSVLVLIIAMVWSPEGDDQLPPNDGSIYERARTAWRFIKSRRGTYVAESIRAARRGVHRHRAVRRHAR